eukprot:TRINITY_DN4459_c0_g1_i5.p1 TRINITY_DN4459_c0_g1~~TRINITY_DN4459_c0_g1_i5.p1  ORF type:complete len:209 (-),score=-32.75 TRINITY_DN4459_c0_g1_i5:169-738(-)
MYVTSQEMLLGFQQHLYIIYSPQAYQYQKFQNISMIYQQNCQNLLQYVQGNIISIIIIKHMNKMTLHQILRNNDIKTEATIGMNWDIYKKNYHDQFLFYHNYLLIPIWVILQKLINVIFFINLLIIFFFKHRYFSNLQILISKIQHVNAFQQLIKKHKIIIIVLITTTLFMYYCYCYYSINQSIIQSIN